jgi:hypothetical protein
MPTHINQFRQNHDVKLSIAKAALNRLLKNKTRGKAVVSMQEGQLVLLPSATKQTKYMFDKRFPQITEGGAVDAATIEFSKKEFHALYEYLRRRGYALIGKQKWEKIKH